MATTESERFFALKNLVYMVKIAHAWGRIGVRIPEWDVRALNQAALGASAAEVDPTKIVRAFTGEFDDQTNLNDHGTSTS